MTAAAESDAGAGCDAAAWSQGAVTRRPSGVKTGGGAGWLTRRDFGGAVPADVGGGGVQTDALERQPEDELGELAADAVTAGFLLSACSCPIVSAVSGAAVSAAHAGCMSAHPSAVIAALCKR